MTDAGVAAVILAAGASRRLGTPKQLIQFNGETLLARAIRLAREARLQPIIVVLGAEYDAITAAVSPNSAVFIYNEEWPEGMASSMRAGLDAADDIAPQCPAVLIMPCDQPRLSAEHLRAVAAASAAETEPCIACSTYAGVRGVPALFPRSAVAELKALSGDAGARKLLMNPPCRVIEVPFPGGEIDIDAREDLAELE